MLIKAVLSYAAILALAGAMAFTVRPALATQVSCGAVLTTDTVLNSDLSDCPGDGLIISADNIRIDFNGYSIAGTGAPGSAGIRNIGHDGVTIEGGDFIGLDIEEGFEVAILISGASNNRVHDLFVQGSSFGIALVNSDHNRIEGNAARGGDISHCGQVVAAGIALFDSDHNQIRDNVAELSDFGIALVNSAHNRLENNEAAPEGSDGNPCFGIALFDSDDNQVRDNLASQNRGPGGDGIFIAAGSSGNLLKGNLTTLNTDDGIDVDDPTTTISKNTANNNDDLGIEAVEGVKDGGGNTAAGNGNPARCVGVVCQ